jgi:phage terminase large subunit-like protein
MVLPASTPQEARRKAEASFWWFCVHVMGFQDLYEPLHRRLCEFIQEIETADEKYASLLIPRGHFKTTLASVSYPIWRLVRHPELRILIAHGKRDQSTAMVREIKTNMEMNALLRELWPDVLWNAPRKESPMWLQERLAVKHNRDGRVPSVMAASVEASVVGLHFDLIIHDDLVFAENVNTQELRANTKRYRRESEALMRTDECKVINVGTRWHEDDAHGELIDPTGPYAPIDGHRQVRSLVLKAICDEQTAAWMGCEVGEPLFPTRYTLKRLDGLRQRMGDYLFGCQFLNDPQPDSMRVFDRGDLQWFDSLDGGFPVFGTPPLPFGGKSFKVFAAMDPNRSEKEHADACALPVCAIDEDGEIWLLDLKHGHPVGAQKIDWLRETAQKWHPEWIAIETTGFQIELVKWAQKDQLQTGVFYEILETERSRATKKWERIRAMAPLVKAGGLHVRKCQWGELFASELDKYGPNAKSDDILDALADIYAFGSDAKPSKDDPKVPYNPFLMSEILSDIYAAQGQGDRMRLGRAY